MVAMFWMNLILLVAIATGTGHKDSSILCECTTSQCLQQGNPTCTTEGLCFTQYLDRGLGTPSLVRGCTDGRTPLLCENRKPTRARNWPLLHCCGTHLCNRGAVPTPPPWHGDTVTRTVVSVENIEVLDITSNETEEGIMSSATELPPSPFMSSVQKSPWPHIVSPVYVSVLVLGVVSLVIIGLVAATVIRRNNRLYAGHYVSFEFQPWKSAHLDCDPDIEFVGSAQPCLRVHGNT